MKIKIKLNNPLTDSNAIRIQLSNEPVDLHIQDNFITFEKDCSHGFYLLQIRSTLPLVIEDVYVDGNSLRHFLYLSYLIDDGVISQPRTDIQNDSQVWCMPLINTLSKFYSHVQMHIQNGNYGKNLLEKYYFFLPESIKLSERYPQVIRDFFAQDANFGIIDKTHETDFFKDGKLPFQSYDGEYSRSFLEKEILNNLGILNFPKLESYSDHNYKNKTQGSTEKNEEEFQINPYASWSYQYFLRKDPEVLLENINHWKERFLFDKGQWPELYNFLDGLPCSNIETGWIAKLPKKTFIYPHCDSKVDCFGEPIGTACFYVPVTMSDRVYFKFGNFGLVDLSTASFISPRKYAHAVVNDSDQDRYIIWTRLIK